MFEKTISLSALCRAEGSVRCNVGQRLHRAAFAALAFAACAGNGYAGESAGVVRASLELAKNGVPVSRVDLSMNEGWPSSYSGTTTHEFNSECDSKASATTSRAKQVITSGGAGVVTPLQVASDSVTLAVRFEYHELINVKTYEVAGCKIEVPTTYNYGNTSTVQIKRGQPVALVSTNGSDKYVLTIRKL